MILENIEILDAGAEGMAIGKTGDQVIFVPFVVPGDIVDVQITKKKRRYLEGKVVRIRKESPLRIEPHCSHFGLCGGCRWQNMGYADQLRYKQKQVFDSLTRIGKLESPLILPILASPETRYYRNKLDFTFSVHRWLTAEDKDRADSPADTRAIGFHVPQFFDKVVDIHECFHMKDPANAIRNASREYAIDHDLAFYDVRTWQGLLRNLIIRTTNAGGLMIILVATADNDDVRRMCDFLLKSFPQITSFFLVVNRKKNDSLYDLDFIPIAGDPWITEKMPPFRTGGKEIIFRIGPLSFFQTNPLQAMNLYREAAEFAGFEGGETVYDLYTGTGTIANYIAPYTGRVIGIESVEAAVTDARVNSQINGITNTVFFAGETEKVMTPEFIASLGIPDIIITDPPRNGMHEKVVNAILEARPRKVVYVSCNPATQARDLALMSGLYVMEKCLPVDMFPHTHHVENIALLRFRG